MGRHIVVTVYFADEWYQQVLADHEPDDEILEHAEYAESQKAMEKLREDAMEDIDLYISVWNTDVYTTYDEHRSQCRITLPKKADLDAGLFSLAYHLFERGQIVGFTVMHTGA